MNLIKKIKSNFKTALLISFVSLLLMPIASASAFYDPNPVIPTPDNPQAGSTGLKGEIPSPPPSTAATIATPTNGQSFNTQPVTVTGLCTGNLLIEVFDNSVFSGSSICNNDSYSIVTYLFNGANTLVAKDFDALNQEGPDSNNVTVNFNNSTNGSLPGVVLTSNYARLGEDPGTQLSWPIIISNGSAPYAVDVTWGDGTPDSLISEPVATTFNITHTYKVAGVYSILIRATDTNGNTAYLQLVAVANGKVNQLNNNSSNNTKKVTTTGIKLTSQTIWTFAGVAVLLSPIAFWLGLRHELRLLRSKLEHGERPFRK